VSRTFDDVRFPVARKQYRCEWCGEPIKIGEKHPQFVGKWEDEFQSWRMHSECYEATSRDDLSEGFTPYEHDRGCSEP
jgi:hypothetical protein